MITIDQNKADAIDSARQISALEVSVTSRHLRSAALGDQYAIDLIRSVEDRISELRA